MHKLLVLAIAFIFSCGMSAQELNATVSVNHAKLGNANKQVFKTLETSLKEFINNTKWTSKTFGPTEKIDCTFLLNVDSYDSNTVKGKLQIQYSRIIYNSTYTSTIFNFNDENISFPYMEFDNLRFNPNSFDSNLTGLIAYYVNIILGLDADSFSKKGGSKYFQEASNIVSLAQQSGYKGWSQSDGTNNRYHLVTDILAISNESYREAIYQYHLKGLDEMSNDIKKAKQAIANSIQDISKLYENRPNAFLLRIFFDAKSDEIVQIFSGGPDVDKKKVVETLQRIYPLNSSKWSKL